MDQFPLGLVCGATLQLQSGLASEPGLIHGSFEEHDSAAGVDTQRRGEVLFALHPSSVRPLLSPLILTLPSYAAPTPVPAVALPGLPAYIFSRSPSSPALSYPADREPLIRC